MKLGANSVLFGGYDMATAFKHLAMAGYDGIEISAIDGMSQHLVLDRWQEIAPDIKRLAKDYNLELLAMEQPSRDSAKMEAAMQAAVEIGIPIINCGPGGKTDDPDTLQQTLDELGTLATMAEKYGRPSWLCPAIKQKRPWIVVVFLNYVKSILNGEYGHSPKARHIHGT